MELGGASWDSTGYGTMEEGLFYKKETVISQVRMFFKDEDRTNPFVMLRRKKHLRKQTCGGMHNTKGY